MFFQIKSYLQFLWNSKNEHAVHSPFVFNLISKCFYDTKLKPDSYGSKLAKQYAILKEYRNSLSENKNTIEVTDIGESFKVFKSNKSQICKIAKTSGITTKRAELLFRMANYLQPGTILKIGTSSGLAIPALALGYPKAKITTLESCPNIANQCQLQFQKYNINNVEIIVGEFCGYLESCNLKSEICSLIYFDRNHSKKATLTYFELLLPTVCNETLWIFDDIHWSSEMEEAWEIVKKHPKVTVTVDTFQWGMVFFRKEQAKEHFVIRI